jgi:hypothetical protein
LAQVTGTQNVICTCTCEYLHQEKSFNFFLTALAALKSFDMFLRLKHFLLMIINIDMMSHDLLSCITKHDYLSKHFKAVKAVNAAGAKS